MNIESNVINFLKYFEDTLQDVEKIAVGDTDLFKKIIYLSIIDTLGQCVCSLRVGERFTYFIKSFSNWPEYSKISLPHLVWFLELVPLTDFNDMRAFVYSKISLWNKDGIVDIGCDPEFSELEALWPNNIVLHEPFNKIKLEYFQHVNLLYRLRNHIVHQFRTPGYGMKALEGNTPMYHQMSHYKNGHYKSPLITWELVYPAGFLKNIIENGIKNLRTYLIKNEINPYDRFKFGTYWLEELNLPNN